MSGSASLEAMEKFLGQYEGRSFDNAIDGDLGTSTLTASTSSSSKVKKEKKEKKKYCA